jgi:hypothetical protein
VTEPPGYPRELERDVTLRDGSRVSIRPIRPEDAPRLVAASPRHHRGPGERAADRRLRE